MKNSAGLNMFTWDHGLVFNEGGRYLTFQLQALPARRGPFKGKLCQIIFRLWISALKRLGWELDFIIDIRRYYKDELPILS